LRHVLPILMQLMKNHARAGFSLIEVAIVLIIMGVMLGAAMPSILRYRQQACLRETKERQDMVTYAVAAYAVINNRLPCPADPAAQGDKKGKSVNPCQTVAHAIGIVPYHTLGLPENQAKDGFGRYMTYAVPIDHNGQGNLCRARPDPLLQLKDESGDVFPQNMQAGDNFVAMVLISHGPLGHGAYNPNGVGKIISSDASEKERVNGDNLVFYDLPFSLGENAFRHKLKWVSRNNLLAGYGRSPCRAPERQPEANRGEVMAGQPGLPRNPFE
jgi:prepilin-type N-terminal cleavage/methylation domain-containing protein